MIKSFAIISLLTTVALAQSSTSSAAKASSTTNPLIPSGISTGCSQFLTTLDSDSTLTACTAPLISATSQYGPGGSSTSSPSAASITSALNNLCSSSSGCTESTMQGKLAEFYSACSVELTSTPNADVVKTYDILYMLIPLKTAVCSKDDSGKYCVTESHKPSNSATPSGLNNAIASGNIAGLTPAEIQEYLYSPAALSRRAESPAMTPNATTIGGTNLPFLFLQPSLAAADLCTACTRNVLTSYIQFESDVPYALGIGSSPMLNGQSALYSAVQGTCGKNFLSGAVQAAGGLSDGNPNFNGASRSITGDFQNTLAILGAVTVAFASVL